MTCPLVCWLRVHGMNTGENGNVKNRSHDGKKVQCLWREAKLSTKAESCLDVVTSVLVKWDSGSFLPSSEAKSRTLTQLAGA